METYKTIKAAREHAKIKNIATHILEIEEAGKEETVYLCTTCSAETLRKCKPMAEIKKIIGNAVDLSSEKREEKEAKKKLNIIGLAELEKIIVDWDWYQECLNQMMENEMNDGVNPPRRPKTEVAEIAKKYPVAAAYIKADNWSMASHYVKSIAGNKAKKTIRNGGDYKTAIIEMEETWAAHCDKNKWN